MICVLRVDGVGSCPVLMCEVCGDRIDDAHLAMAFWCEDFIDGEISGLTALKFCHKGKCDKMRAPLWLEIDAAFAMLLDNCGLSPYDVVEVGEDGQLDWSRKRHMNTAKQFRLDAIADGWHAKPTYDNRSLDHASTLERAGFRIQVSFLDTLAGWGPDGLQIQIREPYTTWADFLAHALDCLSCQKPNSREQYSFAGRCCKACLPEMRQKHEQPGWNS